MKKLLTIATLATALSWGGMVLAHEGHKHSDDKVMGTVVQVHSTPPITHIEIKTAKGEEVVVTADQATKFMKDGKNAALADVRAGMRVVAKVTHDGQVMKASEVSLGAVDPGAHQPDAKPHNH